MSKPAALQARNRLLYPVLLKPGNRAISLIIALLIPLSVAWPLQNAGWGDGLPPLILLVLMGAALAFIINKRFSPIICHALAVGLGALIILLLATQVTPGNGFLNRLINLFWEIGIWIYAVTSGEIQGGNIEFIIILLGLFWTMGYLTVWQVLRHHQWWATILPAGMVLLLTLYNLPEEFYFYFPIYIALSFLLITHITIGKRQELWQKSYIPLSTPLRFFHLVFVMVFILAGILVAWEIPSIKAAPLSRTINRLGAPWSFVEYQFGRLFASLPARKPILLMRWNDNHVFGGPPQLSENVLFTVSKGESHYWRARIYDKYNSQGWYSSPLFLQAFDPALIEFPEGEQAQRVRVKHEIRLNAVTDTLLPAGIPLSSDTPAQLAGRENAPWDVFQVKSMLELHINQRYEIESLASVATPEELRQAGNKYPYWVEENYLQLPRTLPPRVRELSKEVSRTYSNPYDKSVAILEYLKKTYPYSLNIPAPPKGSDGVDYFLFSQKAGYCDYFASAMAVMLRSAGIPARLVIGFAPGEWDESRQSFIVRDLNYHSWPEVYFPGYGWIEFEPTPPEALEFTNNQQRPAGIVAGGGEEDEDISQGEETSTGDGKLAFLSSIHSIQGYTIMLAFLILSCLSVAYYIWWGRLANLGNPGAVYAKMCRLSSLAGLGPRTQQTPLEYSRVLSHSLPSQSASISLITEAYIETQYSSRKFLSYMEQEPVNKAWRSLRGSLIRQVFKPKVNNHRYQANG